MAPPRLDLHSLIVFYHVARDESITRAADELCLTQPTVTYHIRTLERNIGIKLLEIKRQKVVLTTAGTGLYNYASEIYRQMCSAEQYLENLKEASLRVGISMTFSACAGQAASAFERLYPGKKLVMRSATSGEIIEDIVNSQIDLGIIVSSDYSGGKIRAERLSDNQKLVMVVSASSPIAKRQRLEFINLCGYPLIVGPESSATRRIMLKKLYVGGCSAPAPIIVEVNNVEWGISLVENGGGVGLYHVNSVARAIEEGRLKILPLSSEIYVSVDAVTRADVPEHPMAEKFTAVFRKILERDGTCTVVKETVETGR